MEQYQHQAQYSPNLNQPSAFPQQFPESSFQQDQPLSSEERSTAFLPHPHFPAREYSVLGDMEQDRGIARDFGHQEYGNCYGKIANKEYDNYFGKIIN